MQKKIELLTQSTGDQLPKKKSNRKLMCIPIILGVIISLINWCKKSKVVVIVTSSPKVVAVSMSLVLLTALTGTSLYYFYTQPGETENSILEMSNPHLKLSSCKIHRDDINHYYLNNCIINNQHCNTHNFCPNNIQYFNSNNLC